jgi:predicted transcriptional regulator
MLAVAKTLPIKQTRLSRPRYVTLKFKKTTPHKVFDEIAQRYSQYIAFDDNKNSIDEEYVVVSESSWYKEMSKSMTPGNYLKTLRESCGHTQSELGAMLGVSASRLCDFEAGRRQISKTVAKKLSSLFLVPAEKFI